MELAVSIIHDELVDRCQKGDMCCYAELYKKYSRAMYNTSLRIVNNGSDAEDILQEAFTDAFKYLNDFNFNSPFGAWFKKIVVNKSISLLRKRKMLMVDINNTDVAELADEEMIDESMILLQVEKIKKCMQLLNNEQRTVLSLYLFEGYDHEEISEILHISSSAVRSQYMRARQKLLNLIKKENNYV
ncbi:MAG TPA: RNA polymerase sigma factor [Chitinophagaceae bacterium]|nr:RNA polymerase sigma factor [Chitinophagaceae bacterium]